MAVGIAIALALYIRGAFLEGSFEQSMRFTFTFYCFYLIGRGGLGGMLTEVFILMKGNVNLCIRPNVECLMI